MVLTANLCNAPYIKSLSKENNSIVQCTCRTVSPDFASDSSVPILDRGRDEIKKESIYFRCDQIAHCSDQSDEDGCRMIFQKENYKKTVAPFR